VIYTSLTKQTAPPSYTDGCIGGYGGVYDSGASSTFRKTIESQWNGTYEPNPAGLALVYFNDVLQFGNATAYGFPLLMDQPGYDMLSIVIFKKSFPRLLTIFFAGGQGVLL
jgi:hypothetical protein